MHISRMHQHVQDQPLGIDEQMAFAARDPLATVITALATRFAGACGLAVDNRGVRFRTAAGQHPGSGAQDIVDGPPRAALAPFLDLPK
jgi:hypothetical protein